jgi:hypothetical protein
MATALTIPERQVLDSVRFRSRELPFRHKTMNKLLAQGLVAGEALRRADGKLSVNYRWSITAAGIAAYEDR